MNKRLPYEEEVSRQLNDLPLPDENLSWEDMKRRLDEDGDDGIIIPPAQKGCVGYGLSLVLLAVVLWLLVKPGKWLWNKNQQKDTSSEKVYDTGNENAIRNKNKDPLEKFTRQDTAVIPAKNFDSVSVANTKRSVKDFLKQGKEKARQKTPAQSEALKTGYAKNKKITPKYASQKITGKTNKRNRSTRRASKTTASILKSEIESNEHSPDNLKNNEKNLTEATKPPVINKLADPDSTTKKDTGSNVIKKKIKDITIPGKNVKHDSVIKKPIYFAAGVAVYQQLPVNGQKLVPYNSLGRRSTVGDYIPSFYLRMYKDRKWFLQSEFRYGAPQYTKEILYQQKKVVDTFTNTTSTTSNRLKKTFYHQLPVSFNYFILPRFSVGLGFTWNKFSSAVSEREIKETNNITQVDSFQIKTIIRSKKADSNFVKSYFQALIETQYQWKRLSFGARYSFGLQPYIKFQLPGGEHREEKNSSLQIFLRYNLWESRKK